MLFCWLGLRRLDIALTLYIVEDIIKMEVIGQVQYVSKVELEKCYFLPTQLQNQHINLDCYIQEVNTVVWGTD